MIKEIKKEAKRLMELGEFDDQTLFETACGACLTFLKAVGSFLVVTVLLVTFPIWGVPYLIYKTRKKEQEDE